MKNKKQTLNEEISQMKRMMGKLMNEGFLDGDKVFDHFSSDQDIRDAILEKLEEESRDQDELDEFNNFWENNDEDVMEEYEMAGGNNSMNAADAAAQFIIDSVRNDSPDKEQEIKEDFINKGSGTSIRLVEVEYEGTKMKAVAIGYSYGPYFQEDYFILDDYPHKNSDFNNLRQIDPSELINKS